MNNPYYVYVALLDGLPRYVGFGKCRRTEHVNSGVSHVRKLNEVVLRDGKTFDIEYRCTTISKEDAIDKERSLIKKYGREDLGTGSLWNCTDGGIGCRTHSHTPASKAKISEASKRMWQSIPDHIKQERFRKIHEKTKATQFKKGQAPTFLGGSPRTYLFTKGDDRVTIHNLTEWCTANGQSRNTYYSWKGKIIPKGPLKGYLMTAPSQE
jgi:hypothetical protein